MDATLTDPSSIRNLSRLLTCLSKLGQNIQITPHPTPTPTLSLRTINATQSAYASFILHPPFFASLHLPPSATPLHLPTRSILPALRAPQAIRALRLRGTPTRFLLTVQTRASLTKTFRIPVLDGRIGRTAFPRDACHSTLHIAPRFLSDLLQNFHAKLDELTLTPAPASLALASFVDDPTNPANIMLRTELLVQTHEFDVYRHASPAPLPLTIFCKYFRAALEFAEPLDAPLRMYYAAPGHPVLFDVTLSAPGAPPALEAHFVFASRHVPSEPGTGPAPEYVPVEAAPPTPYAPAPSPTPPAPPTQTPLPHMLTPPVQPVLHAPRVSASPPPPVLSRVEAPIYVSPPAPRRVEPVVVAPSASLSFRERRDVRVGSEEVAGTPALDSEYTREEEREEEEEEPDDGDDYVEGTPPP